MFKFLKEKLKQGIARFSKKVEEEGEVIEKPIEPEKKGFFQKIKDSISKKQEAVPPKIEPVKELIKESPESEISEPDELAIRERIKENTIRKGYSMIGRDDIRLLDDLLVIDNTLESWIWRDSVATAPFFHIYNLMQEIISPSGDFVKEDGYTFDLKLIRENF